MLSRSLVSGLFFAPFLCALASPVVHEALTSVPKGWSLAGTPAPSELMVLQVALQQQNLDKLESMIYDVSTPGSSSYGQHLEGDAVSAMVAPANAAAPAVESWLKAAGVKAVHTQGEYVTFAATVEVVNSLLSTQFHFYGGNGMTKLRTTQYSVPQDLVAHIDFISPTTFFGNTKALAPVPEIGHQLYERKTTPPNSTNGTDPSCADLITPQCIKEIYKVGNYKPDPKSGSKIGFGSFLNQSARVQDLDLFEKKYDIPEQGFTVQLINGATNDQSVSNNHGEANLDVEYIVGTSHPLPIISFITGGSPPFIPNLDEPNATANQNEPYLNYYQYLLAQPNKVLPAVISNSYGDDEQTVPPKYARRVCNMIGQLGLRGISVLESSGDTGVGAPCQSNDGKKTPQFTPQFPGTCPFITAVGGTQALNPEVAWVASSGGFSNYFTQPQYQSKAVDNYFANEISPATLQYFTPYFNRKGRGFPDVSAHSLTPEYVYTQKQMLFLLLI